MQLECSLRWTCLPRAQRVGPPHASACSALPRRPTAPPPLVAPRCRHYHPALLQGIEYQAGREARFSKFGLDTIAELLRGFLRMGYYPRDFLYAILERTG